MKKLALLTTAMVLLAACNQKPAEKMPAVNVETEEAVMESANPETMTEEGTMMEAETAGQVVQVDGDNFTFSVNEIKAKKGDVLKVNFTNKEGFHDFVIDELEVNTGMVAAGSSKEVTIPTDKPGTYEFYCSVGNHREQGMKGTLIIE